MIIRSKEELFDQIVNNNKSFYDLTFSEEFNYDEARKVLPEIKKEGKEKAFQLIHDIFFNFEESQIETIKQYADEGDGEVCCLYAIMKSRGEFVAVDIDGAIQYFEKALEKGVYYAAFFLSLIYTTDEYYDEEKVKKYGELAVENGIYDGYYSLAQLCDEEGDGIFKTLDKGASLGSVKCNNELGKQAFYMGDFETSEKYLKEAWKLDDIDSGVLLSRLFNNTERFEEGGSLAAYLTDRRENLNSAWFALAEAHYFKFEASSEEAESGFTICKALIDNNYDEAYYLYGCMLLDGFGCKKDLELGINALRKAIEYYGQLECELADFYVKDSKEIISKAYKLNGLCQYCGGEFTGFLSKKCTKCGRKKDY